MAIARGAEQGLRGSSRWTSLMTALEQGFSEDDLGLQGS
jgi:hypothetical protein